MTLAFGTFLMWNILMDITIINDISQGSTLTLSYGMAGYSFVQGPSTCMVRPHPALWRVIHGMVIIYLLALVFLLFQTVDDARQLLKVCQISPEQLLRAAIAHQCVRVMHRIDTWAGTVHSASHWKS